MASKFARKELDAYGQAGSIAEEVFNAVRTVVAFGGQEKELDRYTEKLRRGQRNNIKRNITSAFGSALMWFFVYGSYALAFWFGVKFILEERDLPPDEIVYTPANMISVRYYSILA